jgi:uncharacterized membrane protein YfcA
MMLFELALFFASVLSAAIAGITGFGIGSILTPLLALRVGTKLAVAAIAIPHFMATALRFWTLRRQIDKRVLLSFGMMSALGGLVGALLHNQLRGSILTAVFGCLLVFAGFMGSAGFSEKLRFGKFSAWVAGGLSGIFGGLVGNQGGIRAAAMLSFELSREGFVATSTAIGIIVDVARLPVYLVSEWRDLEGVASLIAVAAIGVMMGTVFGTRLLRRIPEKFFRRLVSASILLLGLYMLYTGVFGDG